MIIDIITIFPGLFQAFIKESLLGKALEEGIISVKLHDLRTWAKDRHRSIDDSPYGGDEGMVFMPGPVCDAVDDIIAGDNGDDIRRIMLCPKGEKFDAAYARRLSESRRILFLCGRYEGFDARIAGIVGCERLSIGDFVLSGGELACMTVIEAISRFIPGVIGSDNSVTKDSFEDTGLLDWPDFTRPSEYRGIRVPEVLLSGNHSLIRRWRRFQQLAATRELRPDLFEKVDLTEEDEEILCDSRWEVWL